MLNYTLVILLDFYTDRFTIDKFDAVYSLKVFGFSKILGN